MKRIITTICALLTIMGIYAAENLAVTATNATASSYYSGTAASGTVVEQTPDKAVDYLTSTYWSPKTTNAGEWILLEWSSAVTLNTIQLEWLDTSDFAKEYSIYALDAVPDTVAGRQINAGMLPDSIATLLYKQASRTKLANKLERITIKEVTTKYLLVMMGASASKQPVKLTEIYLFNIEVPKLTRFTVEPRMVALGVETEMTMKTLDQEGKIITDNITISVPDSVGTLKNGKLKATAGGWITITAKDTLNDREVEQRVYVLSDNDAPAKPADGEVYASLLPASAGTTKYASTSIKGAIPVEGELKLNGQSVKMVHKLGSLTINNDQVTCAADTTFNPAGKLYEKLRLSIFSPTDANGTLQIEEVGNVALNLKAGEWKNVEVSVADKEKMGSIVIDMESGEGNNYPEVALANIYFTKSPIRLTSLEVKPQFVLVGDSIPMTMVARDQQSQVVTENIVYSVDADSQAKLTDKGWLVARKHGWLTITATDTISKNNVKARIYVLGKEDAPVAPDSAAVYAGLLPQTKGTTVYTANTGNKADPADIVKLNKQDVKPVYDLGTLIISNSEVSSALGKTFNPASKYYGKLHMELFSPVAATGTVKLEEIGSKKVTLTAGKWYTVECDMSKVSKMGNIIIQMDKMDSGKYPHMLLANIYFTKADIDSTDFVLTTIEAGQTFIPKNRPVDLQLTAKNAKGVDVTVYGVEVNYKSDKGTFNNDGLFTATADGPIAIIGSATKDGQSFGSDTIYIYTYPDPDRAPTIVADSVIAIYSDTYGATTYTASDAAANGGYGQQREIELTLTDKGIYVERAVCFGLKLDDVDLSKCDSVHFSVYSYANEQGRMNIEGTQTTNQPFTLKANQWNRIALPLSGTRNKATWLQMFVGTTAQKNNVIIDNVYFTLDPKYGIIERFSVEQYFVLKNDTIDLGLAVYNRLDTDITEDVRFTVSKGKLVSTKKFIIEEDGPVTITAYGAMGSKLSVTINTLPDPATKPDDLARRVNAIYSDTYGARKYTASGIYRKEYEVMLAAGDHAIAALDAQEVKLAVNNLDLSDYIWLKASIFSTIDFYGYVEIEGSFMGAIPIELKKYQWTDLKLILTDYRVGISAIKFIVGNENKLNNVVIDNVRFVKMDPDELDVAHQPDANGFITVVGIINQQNVALVNSITDGGVDLSKATLANDVHRLDPKNPNTIFLVSSELDFEGNLESEQGRHLYGTPNMVMRRSDGAYIPFGKIELYDSEKYPIWYGGIIKTGEYGYSYSRYFYQGVTTAFFPADCTLPAYNPNTKEGFKVYTLKEYDADYGITVGNQHNTNILKNRPYVITYDNPDDDRRLVVVEGTGDLDLRPSSMINDYVPYNIGFHPNLTRGVNSDWFYLLDRGDKIYFMDVTENSPVPAFRCYFTGCERDYGRRIFLFDGANRLVISDIKDDPQGTYIIGEINKENKTTVETINKLFFDLTDATFGQGVSKITPASKNALIKVYGLVFDGLSIDSKWAQQLYETDNIVVEDSHGQLQAYRQMKITDDGESPVWVGGTVETGEKGYTYTRTLSPYEYSTAVVPLTVTVPDGVELYTMTGYDENKGLTLTRVFEDKMTPHRPYIIFNSNEEAVELKATGTGLLNLNDTLLTTIKFSPKSDIVLCGNYGPNKGQDWTRYGIQAVSNSNGVRGRGVPKMELKLVPYEGIEVMPPFRCYFTHIPADGSFSINMVDESKILAVSEPDAQGIVSVKGLLDNENKVIVETTNAAGIDLSKVMLDDDLTTLKPTNPNTLVIVPGSIDDDGNPTSLMAKKLTGTSNMVVRTGTSAMTTVNKLMLSDSEKTPIPWGNLVIDTRELGYSYKRTIAANELTTLTIPEFADAPKGLESYSTIRINKDNELEMRRNSATMFMNNMPFVVNNLTDQDIVIEIESTGYLDLRPSVAGSRTFGTTGSFFANYSVLTSTEEEPIWYFDPVERMPKKAEPGTVLPPFRAYFKGIPADIPFLFGDGSLSGIEEITFDADSDNPYYTLDGRRVATPKKGSLYIRNGKKVIIR